MNWSALMAGVILLSGIAVIPGCKGQDEKTEAEVLPLPSLAVTVGEVHKEVGRSRVEVVGTVEAVQKASLSARISGQIVELPLVLGSEVESGDLLVKISADEISAKVLQAEAQLAQARRNLARENKLQKEGASTRETVKSLQDVTRIAEAAYTEVKTMLDYTLITAPFSGTVTRKMANVGDLASPGVSLLEIENSDALQVLAQVPEALILKVTIGDSLPVHIPAAGLTLLGEVVEMAPAADPMSRTAPVKIKIPVGPDLRVGQFARVTLESSAEMTLVVPQPAVISRGQMDLVFVVEENIARLRLIRTGAVYDGNVEILSGLDPGEVVVVRGAEKLQDGQPLTIETN
ncbi:MAG: efflux RND transporter periplasmic adaptor subunit [Proteobacteria bacterium]|nr:efflux RND transporter periplasmic adaptor subunit [Pseudomonadota bacterium]MBU1058284.1 efflux RND transporter periplasmic adaptor subunit [Pseudomonadota bacterium]